MVGRTAEQAQALGRAQLALPGRIAGLCREEGCDLMLLSGDLFDGEYSRESLDAVRQALREAAVPVFISPGNHDFCGPASPYLTETWPENVHIFTHEQMEAVVLPELSCRVYGAGYRSMDCGALLRDFHAEGEERFCVGVLHGDPVQSSSAYCPVTAEQVRQSGLAYLALGHVHKNGSFRAGAALCAWPGCPMGRGFDELGEKGVLIVTLEDTARERFVPLETPRFYDWELEAGENAADSLRAALPAVGSGDFYRVAFTGESAPLDLERLRAAFPEYPNLELRDRTVPPAQPWKALDEDSLEGAYFRLLRDAMEGRDEKTRTQIELAARISRQLLDGQEVKPP